MFAINHAATAPILKKIFKDVPIIRILISVQFMELLWVLLNYLGIERTTTEKLRSTGSHSRITFYRLSYL